MEDVERYPPARMHESTHACMQASPPQRIQRLRTPGWRAPAGAVYVGRPSRWGNLWRVVGPIMHLLWEVRDADDRLVATFVSREAAHQLACDLFHARLLVGTMPLTVDEVRHELRGKSLMCWCPLDFPCHADPLLRIANR